MNSRRATDRGFARLVEVNGFARRGLRLAVLPALLLTVFAIAAPAAGAAKPGPAVHTGTFDPAARQAALAHWTPERMRAVGAKSSEADGSVNRPWSGPIPHGVGRLFFTEVPGEDHWCTATAVGGANKDLATTAAHCVWPGLTKDGTQIKVTNAVFVPGYRDGQRPQGVFAARVYLLPESYTQHSSPDIAMIAFDQDHGSHLAERTEPQRISFDRAEPGKAAILGYPGSHTARGNSLYWCDNVKAEPDSTGTWSSPCDMAGGSSGGPWLTDFDPKTGSGTVVAVTSQGTMGIDPGTGDPITTALSGAPEQDMGKTLYDQAGAR